jgi:transcriptional regulator with XRE-family HTH domain/ribosomal protein S27AE
MNTLEMNREPQPQESLAAYIRRIRTQMGLSQRELAEGAGIHLQSIGKLERGKTSKLNRKTQSALACALKIPSEYLTAVGRGVAIDLSPTIKFCPHCWIPGTEADPLWMDYRAKYCFLCSHLLRQQCSQCTEPIVSLKHRFCPYCGTGYKSVPSSSVS